jgi:hypothetical protein
MTGPSRPHSSRLDCAAAVVLLGLLTIPARGGRAQSAPERVNDIVFAAYRRADPLTNWSLKKLQHEIPDLKGVEPDNDQTPLAGILSLVRENVKALLANFVNTTSLETIEETRVRNYPPMQDSVVQRFHYLMLLQHDKDGVVDNLVEYRTDLHGHEESPAAMIQGFLKTTGFASMPLYFGPDRRTLSDFRYLGSQVVDGQRSVVVAFAEHAEPAAAQGAVRLPGGLIPTLIQGVAWIDSASFQILRMQTDLLAPQPVVGLDRETTEVHFHQVHFAKAPAPLWLPEEVDVTLGFNGLTYTNRHHYSDYEVFNVSTDQQISGPKAASHP